MLDISNQYENDWNITLCVALFRPYSVKELSLPNCIKCYLFVTRKPQTCSKSLEKIRNGFARLCYCFFSVNTEYVRQYQQFNTTHLLLKRFVQELVPSRHFRETDVVFMLCQFFLSWTTHVRNVCWKNSICFFQDFVLQNLYLGA